MNFYSTAIFFTISVFLHTAFAAPSTETNVNDSKTDSDSGSEREITPENVADLVKMYARINDALVVVAHYSPTVASETESNLSKIQDQYPTNTKVGAFVADLRTILKNRNALTWFDFLDRTGIVKGFEGLVSSEPELFAPLFSSLERIINYFNRNEGSMSQRSVDNAEAKASTTEDKTPSPLSAKLRQIGEIDAALANISRISPEDASEIDSAFANLQKTTFPENTPFGGAMTRMRTLLKNRRGVEWFGFLDKVGIANLEKFITTNLRSTKIGRALARPTEEN